MSAQFGAYVTVRYWCPSLFNEGDDDAFDGDQIALVRDLVESEGVLGLEDSHEIISIEIKEEQP
jgi:hypothetical protein